MLNKAILNGRLTKAPELKQTNSGKSVCGFTIAVDRNRDREKTDFINIVSWGKTAEFINQWFGKGDLITIVGRIEVRNYEDKNGNKRRSWEVQCESIDFCGGKSEGKPQKQEESDFISTDEEFDELPF